MGIVSVLPLRSHGFGNTCGIWGGKHDAFIDFLSALYYNLGLPAGRT